MTGKWPGLRNFIEDNDLDPHWYGVRAMALGLGLLVMAMGIFVFTGWIATS